MSETREQKGEGFPGQRIVVLPRPVVAAQLRSPLLAGLLPTDVGCFPSAAGHLRERERGAEQWIAIYCAAGRGWVEVASRRHCVEALDLLVLPPGVAHAYGADSDAPWTIHWFHALGSLMPAFVAELGVSREQPVVPLRADLTLLGLLDDVIDTLEHGYTPTQLLYAAHTVGHWLARAVWLRHQAGAVRPDPQQQITRSIEFMKQHLDRRLPVGDLARLAGLSASHYTMRFKAITGYSPMEYFIRLRLHRACQLLDTTSLSVKEIAAEVGYPDPLYFSRAFRTVMELAPSEYREVRKG